MTERDPRVRVVVVHYNGGASTLRCLEALEDLDWPRELLEIVLVDNASTDDVVAAVRREMPSVRVLESPENLGFAGGCNLALRDLDRPGAPDYVALLNPDAVAAPTWLRPLVAALESDDATGAACSKLLFAPSFVALRVESLDGARVTVTSLETDGRDLWADAQFREGCRTSATRGSGASRACVLDACAEIRIPTDPDRPVPTPVLVGLSVERPGRLLLQAGAERVSVGLAAGPAVVPVPLGGPRFDVINNVGSCLLAGGYGADRGFLEEDHGQFEHSAEVFAWCGGAVLLSARYLRDVGIFDDSFFMYYEDTDLAWRGRLAGWRYVYVPESVVRHEHAASSGEGSALFEHYVARNRLLTLARNAPWSLFARGLAQSVRRNVAATAPVPSQTPDARSVPSRERLLRRLRSFAGFVALLPRSITARRRQHVSTSTRRAIVDRWVT